MLPPRAHVALLRDELGGVALVGLEEVDGFLPFGEPEFVLGHYCNCETGTLANPSCKKVRSVYSLKQRTRIIATDVT